MHRLAPECLGLLLCVACAGSTPDTGAPGASGAAGSSSGPSAGGAGGTTGSAGAAAGRGGESALGGASGAPSSTGGGPATGGQAVAGQASGGQAGGGQGGGWQAGGGQAGGGQSNNETPPEGVPASYRLIYRQSFAAPASMDDLVFANPTQWHHDATGFLASTGTSYAPPYRSPFSVAIVKAFKLGSFVMDVELLQTSPDGDGHRDMVLIWNFVSPSQFYYAHISTAHDGVAHNIHIVNNADRTAISDTFTPGYDWGRDVWKKFRVVRNVADGSMAVYDRALPEPILTANDTTFSDGYVGVGSFDNTGQVRNLEVWAEASTPGNPAFFSPAPP